jgi:tRNA-splicing ligase RtcB
MSHAEAKRLVRGWAILDELRNRAVHVRAAGLATVAEEIPEAYKGVADVVRVVHETGISKRVARLRPIGVIKR